MRTTRKRGLAWGLLLALGLIALVASLRSFARVERGAGPSAHAPGMPGEPVGLGTDPVLTAPHVRVSAEETVPARTRDADPPEGMVALRVRVLDADEGPLAGARVQAFEASTPLVRTTDEDGECSFHMSDAGGPVRLRAEADGRAHSSYAFDRYQPAELQLWPAARVRGRVLCAQDGTPVAGARIRYEHSYCDGCGPDLVVSAPDGSFELAEVACLNTARLAVEAEGFVPLERLEFLLPRAEPEVEQDLHLLRGLEVRGIVRDWVTLAGIPGARVAGLVTDAEGRFQGRLAPSPGTTTTHVVVSAAGHGTLGAPFDLAQAEHEFRLPRLVTIEGEVRDEGGAPLQGANVAAGGHGPVPGPDGTPVESSPLYELPPGHHYSCYDEDHAVTDSAGRFRLAVLPWCLNLDLVAFKLRFERDELSLPRLGEPGSTRRVSFTLARPATRGTWIRGHVLLNGYPSSLQGVVRWQGPMRSGEARFEGQFEVAVEPGDVTLRFSPDNVPGVLEGAEHHARPRADEELFLPVSLRVAEAKIAGRARFEDGTPVPRASVNAISAGELFVKSGLTDERGEFELEVADFGPPYALHAAFLEQELIQEGVAAGSSGIELVFEVRRRLLVRVVDATTGAGLSLGRHVKLFARTKGRLFAPVHSESDTPDLAGWHEVWLDAASTDLLVVPVRGDLVGYGQGLVHDVELVAPGGSPARVELALRRRPPLVLELDPRDGPWPDGHELLLVEETLLDEIRATPHGLRAALPGLTLRSTLHFEAGRAELAGLEPGRYRFVPWPRDVALDPPEVRIEAEAGLPLHVRWRRER